MGSFPIPCQPSATQRNRNGQVAIGGRAVINWALRHANHSFRCAWKLLPSARFQRPTGGRTQGPLGEHPSNQHDRQGDQREQGGRASLIGLPPGQAIEIPAESGRNSQQAHRTKVIDAPPSRSRADTGSDRGQKGISAKGTRQKTAPHGPPPDCGWLRAGPCQRSKNFPRAQ